MSPLGDIRVAKVVAKERTKSRILILSDIWNSPFIRNYICGGKGIRTPDPLHAMQVLYQLSYTPGLSFEF